MLSLVPASVSKQRHPQRCSNYSPAFLMQNAAWSAQVPERLSACRSSSREECRSRSRTMPGTPASITSACPGSPFTALCPAARPRTGRPQGSAFARYRATHNSPNYAAASLPGSCLRMAQAAAHGCHAESVAISEDGTSMQAGDEMATPPTKQAVSCCARCTGQRIPWWRAGGSCAWLRAGCCRSAWLWKSRVGRHCHKPLL